MYHVKESIVLENGDWEYIEQLGKRVVDLEANVSNLVAWAMNMQNQVEAAGPTIEEMDNNIPADDAEPTA